MKGVMSMCRIKILKTGVLFLGLFAIYVLSSCQSLGISIGDRPGPGPGPGYEEQGPPPWAPAHGYRAKYKYRYYPNCGVYYEGGRGVYFYYKDGQWQVSASIPVGIRIDINDYITLEMDTDRPYEYHNDVVKRYPPGQLKKEENKKGKNK
jgi:hypothetical protein